MTPDSCSYGSGEKVWWILSYHDERQNKIFVFEWEARIVDRVTHKSNCPYLSGQKVHPGFNDLESQYPEIAAEWNYEKNHPLLPSQVPCNSGRKVWWKLDYYDERQNKNFVFEWQSTVNSRIKGAGCPYLAGKLVHPGFNDLEALYPEIAAEWNYEKNYPLKPSDVTYASAKKVWWLLSYNDPLSGKHFDFEWQSVIHSRTIDKIGCPYLSGKQVYPGFNDLKSQYPEIAAEWNYEKNHPLLPSQVTSSSSKEVWWLLSYDDPKTGKHFNFEWQTRIAGRVFYRTGCPYLSNQKVYPGFNDLEALYPEIAAEWNYEKNYPLKPSDVTSGSKQKIWWKCKTCGHEWQAIINSRTASHSGCPECAKYFSSSFPEAVIYFYVKKYFADTIWVDRSRGFELDIYIPSVRTGVEYDGYFWHKGKQEKDKEKNQKCVDNDISLWRIRELLPSLNNTSHDILITDTYSLDKLNEALVELFQKAFNLAADIDIHRDYEEIQVLYVTYNTKKSLKNTYPELLPYFDHKKNKIVPIHISSLSQRKYYWTDPETGDSIQSTIKVMLYKLKKRQDF